jgi:hypoxanthine phosphoribosyltransferase
VIDSLTATARGPVRVLHSADQIREKVRQIGLAVARDHAGFNPVLVGVLNGACIFHADLARATPIELELDFMSVSSYGRKQASSGTVSLLSDLRGEIVGRHVVLCETVVDSGRSVSMLLDLLSARQPASLKVAALLDKRPSREVEVALDYVGWVVGSEFLVGYGLDAADRYRNLPYVGVLEEARES